MPSTAPKPLAGLSISRARVRAEWVARRDVRRDGNKAFDRFKGKKDGTLSYYRALVGEFRKHRDSNAELVELLLRPDLPMSRPCSAREAGGG